MTTLRMASDLAAVLVPIGYAGAVIAAVCAVVAAVAIVRGAGGLAGGAVGIWMVGALMSVTASFASQWTPLLAACGALVAMLVIGGVVRAMVGTALEGRLARRKTSPASSTPAKKVVPATSVPATTATVAVVR